MSVKKTTLVVPAGSTRVEAFISEARVSGRATASLHIVEPGLPRAEADSDEPKAESEGVPWNPLSFASARAAILEAETMLGGRLDELLIFADPPSETTSLADATPCAIERTALEWASGYAELIREMARRMADNGAGTIAIVVIQAERGPLGSMAAGALVGLAESLVTLGSAPVRYIGVKDESGQPDLLASYMVKTLDDTSRESGRLQRFSGRGGLFGR